MGNELLKQEPQEIATPEVVESAVDKTVESSPASLILGTEQMKRMMSFADIMATGRVTVPKHLQNSPGDCLAITMQSVQWGMNPFAVAQKTHIVNGALGYEAQLYNSVVCASGAIRGRFHYQFFGDWDKFRMGGFSKDTERGCGVNVGAVIRGENELTWLPMPVFMENCATRNSPNWKSKPQQQLCYVAVRDWTRLYTPDVILGVYAEDELEDSSPMPNNPAPCGAVEQESRFLPPKQSVPPPPSTPVTDTHGKTISEKQRKMLYAVGVERGLSKDCMASIVKRLTGDDGITQENFEAVLNAFQTESIDGLGV